MMYEKLVYTNERGEMPCAMNKPTSSRNFLDGLSIPKALFAASNRLFARLETLSFNAARTVLA